MKTLIIIRHAKSSHDIEFVDDINRQLNKRGLAEAELMSIQLAKKGFKVDRIISSPALRAISTALIFAPVIKAGYDKISIDSQLYLQGTSGILKVIKNQPHNCNCLLLTGHNPDLHNLVNMLSNTMIDNFPTTAIAIINIDINHWTDINQTKGNLNALLLPEQFRVEP